MTRQEAHEIVRKAGGEPGNSVSRQTSMLVVGMEGWPLLPDGKISNKLRRAEQINQKYQSIQIFSEVVFLELAGLQERKPELEKTYPADEVCRLLKIESQTLQHWERFSLISSRDGMYDFQDIVTLRMIESLLQQGIQCETIATSIRGLSSILPGTDRPLAQLKIVADNPKSLLADLGSVHLAPDGQLAFNFETKHRGEARVVELPSDPLTATEWLERGRILEAQENLQGAEKAYLKAVKLQPIFPEAFFNLGNVLREAGREYVAKKAYRTCLKQDPSFTAAWYNLADVQEAQGQVEEAINSLKAAIEMSPLYADAHFNLASCLERVGRKKEANRHWQAYMKLDPNSQWTEIARSHFSAQ